MTSERAKLLHKYYANEIFKLDSNRKEYTTSDNITFKVGDLVRYSDEAIEMAVGTGTRDEAFEKLYRKSWSTTFLIVEGFDTSNPEIVRLSASNITDAHYCHVNSIQIVTETELLLYV